jgi:hypothetical protein
MHRALLDGSVSETADQIERDLWQALATRNGNDFAESEQP